MGFDYYYGFELVVTDEDELTHIELTKEGGYYPKFDENDTDDNTFEELWDKHDEELYHSHPTKVLYENDKWIIKSVKKVEEYMGLIGDHSFSRVERRFYVEDR